MKTTEYHSTGCQHGSTLQYTGFGTVGTALGTRTGTYSNGWVITRKKHKEQKKKDWDNLFDDGTSLFYGSPSYGKSVKHVRWHNG